MWNCCRETEEALRGKWGRGGNIYYSHSGELDYEVNEHRSLVISALVLYWWGLGFSPCLEAGYLDRGFSFIAVDPDKHWDALTYLVLHVSK
jgi:hypothetical protein